MDFVSGYQVNQLERAFQLVSEHNNASIKEGEAILESLKYENSFFALISGYLGSRDASQDNKLRAALQLRDYIQNINVDLDSNDFDKIFCIYMVVDSKIGNILSEIFKLFEVFDYEISKIILGQLFKNKSEENDVKALKAFHDFFSRQCQIMNPNFDETILNELVPALKQQMSIGFDRERSTEFFYWIFRLWEWICYLNNRPHITQQLNKTEDLASMSLVVLQQFPIDRQNIKKYQVQLKIQAMKCLIVISKSKNHPENMKEIAKFSGSIWEQYIYEKEFSQECFAYLKMLSWNVSYETFLATPEEVKVTIFKVFQISINHISNYQKQMLSLALEDPQDFLEIYMDNQFIKGTRDQIRRNLWALNVKYHSIWKQFVSTYYQQNHEYLTFIIDSFKYTHVLRYRYQEQIIQNIWTSQIQPHFTAMFTRFSDDQDKYQQILSSDQILLFLTEMRFVVKFSQYLSVSILSGILALYIRVLKKVRILSSVCYYCIHDLFKEFTYRQQSQSQISQIAYLYYQLLSHVKSNKDNLTKQDILPIQSGLTTLLEYKPQYVLKIQQDLKEIIMILCDLARYNRQFELIDVTYSVMSKYIVEIQFDYEFSGAINELIGQKQYTPNLMICYLEYLKMDFADKESGMRIVEDMCRVEYWLENDKQWSFHVALLCYLLRDFVLKNQRDSGFLSKFLGVIFQLSNMKQLMRHQIIELRVVLKRFVDILSKQISENGLISQIYTFILNHEIYKNQSQQIILRMIDLELFPQTKQKSLYLITHVLQSNRTKVKEENFYLFMSILFQYSVDLVNTKLDDGEEFNRLWINRVFLVAQFIIYERNQNMRVEFLKGLDDFTKDNNVALTEIASNQLFKILERLGNTTYGEQD